MDSVRVFAQEVAPLYKFNNWLGMGQGSLQEAEDKVYEIASGLYKTVALEFAGGGTPAFASTGRVIVHYQPYTEDSNEITIGLNIRTLIEDDDYDEYVDVFDERYEE